MAAQQTLKGCAPAHLGYLDTLIFSVSQVLPWKMALRLMGATMVQLSQRPGNMGCRQDGSAGDDVAKLYTRRWRVHAALRNHTAAAHFMPQLLYTTKLPCLGGR